jgi:hypothetical protein
MIFKWAFAYRVFNVYSRLIRESVASLDDIVAATSKVGLFMFFQTDACINELHVNAVIGG